MQITQKKLIAEAPKTKSFFQDIKDKIEVILPSDAETMLKFEQRIGIATHNILNKSHSLGIPVIIAHGIVLMALAKALNVKLQRTNTYEDTIIFSRSDANASWEARYLSAIQFTASEST